MKKRVGIVDYGRGNLRSVEKALEAEGAETALISEPGRCKDLDALVLPGVGAFGDGVRGLQQRGLWSEVREWLDQERPFLGICLGYQMLFEESQESPGVPGLGFFQGKVRRFPSGDWKIPHMGWNEIQPSADCPLFENIRASEYVYFVHSFYPDPEDTSVVTSYCDYAGRFAASAGKGPVQAVQFHPEKSQAAGLKILRNFLVGI